ncbi:MAG: hypothetical protein QM767_05105 [Anaeromyxobacter sp.]
MRRHCFLGEHERAGGIGADPQRAVFLRVLPHRIDHPAEQRDRALDEAAERRSRQTQAGAAVDRLLPMQREVVRELRDEDVREEAGAGDPLRDGPGG